MKMHRIADLNVLLEYKGETLSKQAPPYEISEKVKPDICVGFTDGFIRHLMNENNIESYDMGEYIFTGADFFEKINSFGAFMLHSSAVEYEGRAYLFSANSGTGKSTHTGLWLKVFGDKARIINDDKPVIRVNDGTVYAYGTPWSGKTDKNSNIKVPVCGICFIERSNVNSIEKISDIEAIQKILNQTMRFREVKKMEILLGSIEKVLQFTNVYKLKCNISEEAVMVAYNGMKGD